jgi:hypothetical protein
MSIAAEPRSQGFWKHQVTANLDGRGNIHVEAASMCAYLDLIDDHFNSNDMNPVVVYETPSWGDCTTKLEMLRDILNLWGSQEMIARARQQLMALLLNVAAGNLSLTHVVSDEGATVSQAITYCDNIIDDPLGNYERAKDITDLINNGKTVPDGWIPLDIVDIAYAPPVGDRDDTPTVTRLGTNVPNPFNPSTRIRFDLATPERVRVDVYDVAGRLVARLVDGPYPSGFHSVVWDGIDRRGSQVASGVYFVRMKAGDYYGTRRVVLLK